MPTSKLLLDANEYAAGELRRLVKDQPGRLRIITGEPSGLPYPEQDPRAFVCHAVARVEGPDAEGRMAAYSVEGDWCAGRPKDLLARLLLWQEGEKREGRP